MKQLETVSKIYNTLLSNEDEAIKKMIQGMDIDNEYSELKYQMKRLMADLNGDSIHGFRVKLIEGITFNNNVELYKALKEIEKMVSWTGFLREVTPMVADSIITKLPEYK